MIEIHLKEVLHYLQENKVDSNVSLRDAFDLFCKSHHYVPEYVRLVMGRRSRYLKELREVRSQYISLLKMRDQSPRLRSSDLEDWSDRAQATLELQWEIRDTRDRLRDLGVILKGDPEYYLV